MRCDVPAAGHFFFFFFKKKQFVRWINKGFFLLSTCFLRSGRIIQWCFFICMYVMFCTITLRQRPCKSWTVRLSHPTRRGGGEAYVFVCIRGWELLVICNLRDAIDVVRKKKQLPDVGGIELARNYL